MAPLAMVLEQVPLRELERVHQLLQVAVRSELEPESHQQVSEAPARECHLASEPLERGQVLLQRALVAERQLA